MAATRQRGARASHRAGRGEFALLSEIRAAIEKLGAGRGVVVGIGDDCAVVEASSSKKLVLTTDSTIEGVHYRAGWLTPAELGVRAFRAAVSDIAAMGARPRFVLLSLEIPGEDFGSREALALVKALAKDAATTGAALVGGNVSRASRTGVTVTVIGEAAARPVLRSGARAGEFVFVTGALGGAAAGCRALEAARPGSRVAASASAAFRKPPLRLDFSAALATRNIARAMIDVSDGLLQDLGHIAEASCVRLRLDASMVPVHAAARRLAKSSHARKNAKPGAQVRDTSLRLALTGGEDYELVFTAPESACDAIEKIAAAHAVPVSVIGAVEKGRAEVVDLSGRPFDVEAGFDHLRPKRAKANVRRR